MMAITNAERKRLLNNNLIPSTLFYFYHAIKMILALNLESSNKTFSYFYIIFRKCFMNEYYNC